MTNTPPGRPIRNSAPRNLEKFHVYLLLILGIALVGVGITAMGFATASAAAVRRRRRGYRCRWINGYLFCSRWASFDRARTRFDRCRGSPTANRRF